MSEHFHGAFGGQIIANRDITQHSKEMGLQIRRDVAEDTGMRPPGRGKTFLYGNLGATASNSLFLVNDPVFMAADMAQVLGTSKDPELLTQAWNGFELGKFVALSSACVTTYNIPQTNGSVVEATVNRQVQGPYYLGASLWNPYGGDAFSLDEVQTLAFTSVNENTFLALRAVETTETFLFQLSQYADNAAIKAGIKAGIEGLAVYNGQTVTITGTLTKTGSAWSGTYTIAFSVPENVPQMEARQGPVEHFLVSGGDSDSDYSVNAGSTFSLGISESSLQTNQRNKGGQYSGVVVKGTSSAPSAGDDLSGDAQSIQGVLNAGYWPDHGVNVYDSNAGGGEGSNIVGWYWASAVTIASVYMHATKGGGGSVVTSMRAEYSLDTTDGTDGTWVDTGAYFSQGISSGGFEHTFDFSGSPLANIKGLRLVRYDTGNYILTVEFVNTYATVSTGSADFVLYFPVSATPSGPASTGTGATCTTTTAAGAAAGISPSTSIGGASGGLPIWNLVTDTGPGDWYDHGAQTDTGGYFRFQAPIGSGTITVDIEHNETADEVSVATVCSFQVTDDSDITQLVQEFIASNTATLKRYVRANVSAISGTFAVAVCFADYSF